MESVIGIGRFGVVSRALLKVAIKQAILGEEATLLHEAEMMSSVDHHSLIKIIGVQRTPSVKIIMEFMELGDIQRCLIKRRVKFSILELIRGLCDVSSGMEYLTDNGIVFRDLAARNIFVNSNKNFKIGDFGMAERVDENGDYKETVRTWMMYNLPPEIRVNSGTQIFSWRTDVWAMGLFIWELFQLSAQNFPAYMIYWEINPANELPCPDGYPENINKYATSGLMHQDPFSRPTFKDVTKFLSGYL